MTDKEIIDGYLDGDKGAIDLVTSWIRAVVYHRALTDQIQREDLIADTLVDVLDNFRGGKFGNRGSLKSYVQCTAQHNVIDAFRARERFHRYCEEARHTHTPSEDPLGDIIREDEVKRFLRVLQRLGKECRELYDMLLVRELRYRDIAGILNMTEGAARTRVSRCKKKAMSLANDLRQGSH